MLMATICTEMDISHSHSIGSMVNLIQNSSSSILVSSYMLNLSTEYIYSALPLFLGLVHSTSHYRFVKSTN